jgi:hypothetical protein
MQWLAEKRAPLTPCRESARWRRPLRRLPGAPAQPVRRRPEAPVEAAEPACRKPEAPVERAEMPRSAPSPRPAVLPHPRIRRKRAALRIPTRKSPQCVQQCSFQKRESYCRSSLVTTGNQGTFGSFGMKTGIRFSWIRRVMNLKTWLRKLESETSSKME